jgi:hypothetical protein
VTRWYDNASDAQLKAHWPNYQLVHNPAKMKSNQDHREQAELCQSTLDRWPVLQWDYRQESLDDIIAVHRIAGRWMPSIAPSVVPGRKPTLQYACPLRVRAHHS